MKNNKEKKLNLRTFLIGIVVVIFLIITILFLSNLMQTKTLDGEVFNDLEKVVILPVGRYSIKENFVVPVNHTLVIFPGTTITIVNDRQIQVFGDIHALGTEDEPIVFKGKQGYWGGIVIFGKKPNKVTSSNFTWNEFFEIEKIFDFDFFKDMDKSSKFVHVHFSDVRSKKNFDDFLENDNSYSCPFNGIGIDYFNDNDYSDLIVEMNSQSAVEVYNSSIFIANSKFENLMFLGGIKIKDSHGIFLNNSLSSEGIHKSFNLIQSKVIIYDNKIHQDRDPLSCNDGIGSYWSTSIIASNLVEGKGDDGIDVKSGYAYITDNKVLNNKDDGIDIGDVEISKYFLYNNIINNNSQNGVIVTNADAILFQNKIVGNGDSGILIRNRAKVSSFNDLVKNNFVGITLSFDPNKPYGSNDGFTSVNVNKIDSLSRMYPNLLVLNNITLTNNSLNNIQKNNYSEVILGDTSKKGISNFQTWNVDEPQKVNDKNEIMIHKLNSMIEIAQIILDKN